jgi:O-antigen ligase
MSAGKQLAVLGVLLSLGGVVVGAILTQRALWLILLPGLAVLVWAMLSPYRCLLLLLFSFPIERFGTIPTPWFAIKPFQILAALTLLALLFERALHGATPRRHFFHDPILAWYLAFLVANFISYAVSGNLDDMRAIFHYLMFWLIALLAVLLLCTPEKLQGAVRILALSGALAGLFAILQFAGFLIGMDTGIQETQMVYTTGSSEALRVTSLFFDANVFASFLCLALPLGLAAGQAARNHIERVVAGVGVLAMLVALAFTQSRSGFFGVAAGCIAFLFAQRRFVSMGRVLLVAMLISATLWTALSLYGSKWYSPEIFFTRALAIEQGVADRSHAWKQILEAFYDNPIFGVGPAQATNWGVYIPNALSNWNIFNARIVAHNNFLDVAVGAGLLGLVPFVLFVSTMLWRAWRNARCAPPQSAAWDLGVFAALVSVLVNSLSMTTLMYPFLWTAAGLVVAGTEMHRRPAPQLAPAPPAPSRPGVAFAEMRP